ncbi:toll/interleukin-1 receptor domain-containing protein [Microbulbifer magnicolonia]|uniref:toll/interleukin-1 receptor domain-containing protein n=1 Tax=Microbulbifer magnicolonia TaxID=3109744 RepID=UPI002B40C307|nr:toll/interleukin-1 receptor domain-containing protein [Microbulbifer sp. GG15]
MAIKTRNLRAAAARSNRISVAKSLNEALAKNKQTAFLCHSHKDYELAKGLQVLLKENGWDLYIDWEDNEMPATPNDETARKIKSKIQATDWFLLLATSNSVNSRWCPWEIGYADAVKNHEKILIVPTADDYGNWYGNEYLQLYKKIDEGSNKITGKSGYAVFDRSSGSGTWIENITP